MQTYTTQMDAARKGIITPQMEIVAKKEYRTPEEAALPSIWTIPPASPCPR